MPGKPIKIGPFSGGLNNMSTAGEAKDNELTMLMNMEVSKDESLTTRPPITPLPGTSKYYTNANAGWEILGIYRVSDTEWYLVVMSASSESANDTDIRMYRSGIIGTANDVIISIRTIAGVQNRITAMTQFKDELYFIVGPQASIKGFRWKPGDPFTDIDIPKGNILISWKSRLWVSGTMGGNNADRLWFSYVGAQGPEPWYWEANGFLDVAPGEGGYITAIIPSFNNLIVFKSDGTWRFNFPSSPKQGTVDKISGQVGAAGKYAAVEFENYIYVYDQGYVYELVNSNYAQLNPYVHFDEDPDAVDGVAPGVDLSLVNRRLIVRYYNALYVFTIDTKAWSQWRTYNGIPGKFQELPVDSNKSNPSVYLAASKGVTQNIDFNMIPETLDNNVRLNAAGSYYLNEANDVDDFNIPATPAQQLTLKYTTPAEFYAGSGVEIRTLLNSGSVSTTKYPFTANQTFSTRFKVPENAILLQVSVYAATKAVVNGVTLMREAIQSPSTLMKLSDEIPDTNLPVEHIEAEMLTKTYDYQAASSIKRLFYWGADLVTPRKIWAEARPVGRKNSILWGDLEKYTWNELAQGNWGNPLSWLKRSTAVVSNTSENVDVSENGRFYVKLNKNLRFRQIAFYLKLTTLGNKDSGPAKVFTLTTLVNPKKDTIDTAT